MTDLGRILPNLPVYEANRFFLFVQFLFRFSAIESLLKNERVIAYTTGTTVTSGDVCSDTPSAAEYNVMVQSGKIHSRLKDFKALIDCMLSCALFENISLAYR